MSEGIIIPWSAFGAAGRCFLVLRVEGPNSARVAIAVVRIILSCSGTIGLCVLAGVNLVPRLHCRVRKLNWVKGDMEMSTILRPMVSRRMFLVICSAGVVATVWLLHTAEAERILRTTSTYGGAA